YYHASDPAALIYTCEPPTLYERYYWSESFEDFLALCLVKSPDQRPTAKMLLNHSFIKEQPMAESTENWLMEYINTVVRAFSYTNNVTVSMCFIRFIFISITFNHFRVDHSFYFVVT
ncbi:hypothetical protein XENTR_v10018010, partial [Xenopus tropicalis]